MKSPASLLVEGDFVGWDAQGLVARKGGYLNILDDVLPFDRVEVARVATTRECARQHRAGRRRPPAPGARS